MRGVNKNTANDCEFWEKGRHRIKTILLTSLLVFSFTANADWTKENTVLESVYLTTLVIDWGQTLDIAESDEFYESNRLLGEYPTRGKVNRYFLGAALLHIGVAYILPDKWRAPFQYMSIGMGLGQIGRNAVAGVRISF